MRNPSILTNNLGVPSNGMQQALQKRRSFDDRLLNVLVREQNGSLEATSGSPGALLSPEVPTSRKAKRQSINPALVMSFTNLPQRPPSAGGSPSSPSTPQAQQQQHSLNGHPRSPLREQFSGSDVRMSPKTFTHADNKHSPTVPRMQLDTPDSSSLHDRHYTGRSRSASSSDTHPPSHLGGTDIRLQERSKSPGRMSITFDRVPVRVSSRNELRSDTAPPSFMPEGGRSSPSLNVPLSRHASPDGRSNNNRASTSSLGQTIELPPRRTGSSSRPTSPAHKVDVPHSVESGTDTEAEPEEAFASQGDATVTIRQNVPPLPPPKDSDATKGAKVGTRPPRLQLDAAQDEEDDNAAEEQSLAERDDDMSVIDSADVSEEYAHDEAVAVESTPQSTYIAPALPPIRFSMGGADFADLLKTVGGPEGLRALDKVVEAESEMPKVDVTVTPPPSAEPPTANANGKVDPSPEATPVKRREPPLNRSQSPHSIAVVGSHVPLDGLHNKDAPRPSFQRSQSSDTRDGRPATPRIGDQVYRRNRVDSAASLPPNGRAHITVTSPDNTTSSISRPDTSDLVRRRLQEAVADSSERGAPYVKLDPEFIGAIVMLLDQRKEEFLDMKRKLDGMKVRRCILRECVGGGAHFSSCHSALASNMLKA
jgi:Rho-type GTPase-activating protein 1/2